MLNSFGIGGGLLKNLLKKIYHYQPTSLTASISLIAGLISIVISIWVSVLIKKSENSN